MKKIDKVDKTINIEQEEKEFFEKREVGYSKKNTDISSGGNIFSIRTDANESEFCELDIEERLNAKVLQPDYSGDPAIFINRQRDQHHKLEIVHPPKHQSSKVSQIQKITKSKSLSKVDTEGEYPEQSNKKELQKHHFLQDEIESKKEKSNSPFISENDKNSLFENENPPNNEKWNDMEHLDQIRSEWIQKEKNRENKVSSNTLSDVGEDSEPKGKRFDFRREDKEREFSAFKEKLNSKQSVVKKIDNIPGFIAAVDHEIKTTYDPEERKKNAIKESVIKKTKIKAKNAVGTKVGTAVKTGSEVVAKAAGRVIAGIFQKVAVMAAPALPILSAVLVVILCGGLLLTAVVKYEEEQQDAQSGYFGKMYYWIEYETGKNNEEAFATVLGDDGRAFGIQFDYRYALQPFMRYCYEKNPEAYSEFIPFLNVDKNTLRGNQELAVAWTTVFETNKEEFINDQKEYAKMNYYDGIEERANQFGIRLKERDLVCKGAVLSYSFQCGSTAAYNAVVELNEIEDDEEFLKKIYEIRTRDYPSFSSRYEREYQTAYYLLIGRADFVCPVNMAECTVTSEFGEYRSPSDPAHKGIDLASYGGNNVPVYAAADGKVLIAGYSSSAGNWVVIDHGNGIVAKYMHHESICVSVGQEVKKGQEIGRMGTTGDSTGVHLHFQMELNEVPVNPRDYIVF